MCEVLPASGCEDVLASRFRETGPVQSCDSALAETSTALGAGATAPADVWGPPDPIMTGSPSMTFTGMSSQVVCGTVVVVTVVVATVVVTVDVSVEHPMPPCWQHHIFWSSESASKSYEHSYFVVEVTFAPNSPGSPDSALSSPGSADGIWRTMSTKTMTSTAKIAHTTAQPMPRLLTFQPYSSTTSTDCHSPCPSPTSWYFSTLLYSPLPEPTYSQFNDFFVASCSQSPSTSARWP
mmetsp:Transcript_102115/g.264056  ORF Transcript_102115/g.264056 Transcript_102115/m.264056 type:complete len:237 (+) Transcript_102115:865-1575(+)